MVNKTFLVAVLLALFINPLKGAASDSEQELRHAVASMNDWLGGNSNARQWRKLLGLNILDTQAALGHRADATKLYQIQCNFEKDIDGLEHPVFQRVHRCISTHLSQLSKNNIDISFLIEQAQENTEKYSTSQVDDLRKDVIFKIGMLKKYYRQRLASRERAEVFYEIRPDDSLKFFNNLNLNLPPARNRKVIGAEIEKAQDEILIIQSQLEELNNQLEKINNWKQGIERPEGVEPPAPDENESVQTNLSNSDPDKQSQAIQNGQALLINQKQELEKKIEALNKELSDFGALEETRKTDFAKNVKDVSEIAQRYSTTFQTRSDSYFVRAMDSINKFRTAYISAGDPERTDKNFDNRLELLKKAYQDYISNKDRRAFARLGNLTGWFDSAGRATDLVAAIRAQHSQPNLFFEVSSDIVNQFASQETSEFRRVNQQILNRLIRGIAYVEGLGTIQFVPDLDQARIAIDFSGSIDSDTYTRSGKLTAYAGAHAPFNVRRDIFANVGGMFAGEIYGDLDINSYFKCIDSRLRLVQRIAYKEFLKTKELAESITGESTREEVFGEFEKLTDAQINSGYDQFEQFSQRQIENAKLLPATFLFTANNRLIAVSHGSTKSDLAANNQPQRFDEIPGDVRLKLHETMLSNYVSPLFAGRTMWNTQLAAEIAALTGQEEPETKPKREFRVKFDDARPIQIEFEGNLLSVTITGRFQRTGSRAVNNLQIQMKFKLVNYGDYLTIAPAEKVSIELVDPKTKNISTSSMVSFLESISTNAISDMEKDGVEFPLNLIPIAKLSPEFKEITDQLHLTQIRTEDGWLYTSWKHQPNSTFYSGLMDTPLIQYPVLESSPEMESGESLDSALESFEATN